MKRYSLVIIVLLACFAGCTGKDAKLIQALKNDADFATVNKLLEQGANPNAKDKNGKTALDLAIEMVDRSQKRIDKIKSGEDKVMGDSEIIISQLEGEKKHNQMIVDLLLSHQK